MSYEMQQDRGLVGAAGGSAGLAQAATGTDHEAAELSSVYQRLGALTRMLHDALRELGYDRTIGNAISSLPDARARLTYISRLTGEAAERVLDSVDRARSEQDLLAAEASAALAELKRDPVAVVASGRVLNVLEATTAGAARTNELLTEIMLAQDFHDLTGQVIRKVVDLAQSLEGELLQLLVEATPAPQRSRLDPGILSGPVVDSGQAGDVVTGQGQVDDLLESLGF